ncbi:TPA: hypothetical protein ACH3X2_001127 [Trebouxia sp. C0005]
MKTFSCLQERIMTGSFGEDAGRFRWSVFLVLCNRLMTSCLAIGFLAAQNLSMRPAAPLSSYIAVSLSNVIATTCQYEALKHVTFPVQTLGKCAKMIPVMAWGTLISHKAYSAKDFCVAALVTAGCTCFLLSGKAASKGANQSSYLGFTCMLVYLAFDGFTATFQDKLFKGHQMSIFNQMLYVNVCSAIVSFSGMVAGGQLGAALTFVSAHPDALLLIFLLSLAATLGQLLIVHTIRSFGALVFATIMTTRQFVSVLASCVIFAHPLSVGQWLGTAVVFGSLYFKTFIKKSGKRSPLKNS